MVGIIGGVLGADVCSVGHNVGEKKEYSDSSAI